MELSFGWRPSIPDIRDYKFQTSAMGPLPDNVDLRSEFPECWNQENIGSCTSFSTCALIEHARRKNKKESFLPSRLFLYYNTRMLEGTVKWDSGATLRNVMKSAASKGVCEELLHPYVTKNFKIKPTKVAYTDGKKHLISNYYAIPQDHHQLKGCLAEGYSFVFGFVVYESVNSDECKKNGIINIPGKNERILGAHAICCVGYTKDHYIIRNSWGTDVGDKGYYYMSNDFIMNPALCSDFWTMRTVE